MLLLDPIDLVLLKDIITFLEIKFLELFNNTFNIFSTLYGSGFSFVKLVPNCAENAHEM